MKHKLPGLAEILKTYDPKKEYIGAPRVKETLEERRKRDEMLFDLVESMHPALGLVKLKHIVNPKNPLFKKIKNYAIKIKPRWLPEEEVKKLPKEKRWAYEQYLKKRGKPFIGFSSSIHFPEKEWAMKSLKSPFAEKLFTIIPEFLRKIEGKGEVKKMSEKEAIELMKKMMLKLDRRITIAEDVTDKPRVMLEDVLRTLGSDEPGKIASRIVDIAEEGTAKSKRLRAKQYLGETEDEIQAIKRFGVDEDVLVDLYEDFKSFFQKTDRLKKWE